MPSATNQRHGICATGVATQFFSAATYRELSSLLVIANVCNVHRILRSRYRRPLWSSDQIIHETREPGLLLGPLAFFRFVAEPLPRTPRTAKVASRRRYVVHPPTGSRKALRKTNVGVCEGSRALIGVLIAQGTGLGGGEVGVLLEEGWWGLGLQELRIRRVGDGVEVGENGSGIEALA